MAKQNLFALSEETKDKVIKKINEPGAPDTYTIKPSTMREYYSRVWVVGLDEDLPGITYDEQGVPVTQGVEAWILEKSEQEKIDKRYWKNSNVKLKKLVYNLTEETFIANDSKGKPIPYVAMQDMLGTIWIQPKGESEEPKIAAKMVNTDSAPEGATQLSVYGTWLVAKTSTRFGVEDDKNAPKIANPLGLPESRPAVIAKCQKFNSSSADEDEENPPEMEAVAISADTRDLFIVNPGGTDSSTAPNPNVYKKGNVIPISWNSSSKTWSAVKTSTYGNRLAVCQRDLPDGFAKEFLMPYYTPEMNYGCPPNRSSATGEGFTMRCGVAPGEYVFSNKRLDYCYVNGRYSYEPTFVYTGYVEEGSSGEVSSGIRIEGKLYTFSVDVPRYVLPRFYPDIWVGDKITVKVDASGNAPSLIAIEYPVDYKEGTYLITNDYGVGSEGYAYRGWEDVTGTLFGGIGNTIISVYGDSAGINVPYGSDTKTPTISGLLNNYAGLKIWYKTKPREYGCLR